MAVKSQNIYEYKKVKTIDEKEWINNPSMFISDNIDFDLLKNKINELVIEQNHLIVQRFLLSFLVIVH